MVHHYLLDRKYYMAPKELPFLGIVLLLQITSEYYHVVLKHSSKIYQAIQDGHNESTGDRTPNSSYSSGRFTHEWRNKRSRRRRNSAGISLDIVSLSSKNTINTLLTVLLLACAGSTVLTVMAYPEMLTMPVSVTLCGLVGLALMT